MGLEFRLTNLLKLNFRLFTEMMLLRGGDFTSVASGQQFYDGSDMSVFLPDTTADEYFTGTNNGQIWQSAFRNFIYESGVPIDGTNLPAAPRQYSGVYIHGALRFPDDSIYGHTVDYLNGRIIFNTPQPLDLQVSADFSYKNTRVIFEHAFNQQFSRGFIESKYTTNPGTSMQLIYPSGVLQPFPAIIIDVDERDFEAYEMGNRSSIIKDTIKFHIWALDDVTRDNLKDILSEQIRKPVPMIDFNIAPLPLSGIYNTISPEYIAYQELLLNKNTVTTIGSGHPVRYITTIDNTTAQNLPSVKEYERGMVTYKVSTYLNAPTTPFATIWGPIDRMKELGDTIFP